MANEKFRPAGNNGVSIQDVAQLAGVATSTVSRALTIPGRISEKTRARVLEAAGKLGYTANAAARNLRLGRSKVVLIVLPGPFNAGASQVVGEMLTVIDTELAALGYSLVIANVDRQANSEQHMLDLAFSGQADGAIIISSGVPEAGGRSLADTGIPIVAALFDYSRSGVPSVVTNDRQAAKEAIVKLTELGHRRFLYVSGPKENYHEIERYKGVRLAIKEREDCSVTSFTGDFHFSSGTAAADAYLALDPRPTAVFCCSDDMAIAFMRRVSESGVKVPEDVSVVGFDGSSVGAYTVPSLSSVSQPMNLIGEQVVRSIIGLMEGRGEVGPKVVIASSLLLRESVSKPRKLPVPRPRGGSDPDRP